MLGLLRNPEFRAFVDDLGEIRAQEQSQDSGSREQEVKLLVERKLADRKKKLRNSGIQGSGELESVVPAVGGHGSNKRRATRQTLASGGASSAGDASKSKKQQKRNKKPSKGAVKTLTENSKASSSSAVSSSSSSEEGEEEEEDEH